MRFSQLASSCLSVCPQGKTRFPRGGFLWKLVFVYFSKIWGKNSNLIKTWQEWRLFYIKTNKHMWSHVAQFFLETEMCQKKVLEKIKIFLILRSTDSFFPNKRNTETRSGNHYCSGMSNTCYILWVCVCSLRYPACNAHAPYCHLWRLAVPYFSKLSHKRHEFRKTYWTCSLYFDFLYKFGLKLF